MTMCTFEYTLRIVQTITFTQLRTEPRRLRQALENGHSVDLIHRSKIVAEIKPKIYEPKPFNIKRFARIVKSLNLPRLSRSQMEKNYRDHMMKKYGSSLP